MKRRIRHGGDLQGGVICRRCNAKAANLAGGEVRCGEIGAVISSAETSEAVKCSAPAKTCKGDVSIVQGNAKGFGHMNKLKQYKQIYKIQT